MIILSLSDVGLMWGCPPVASTTLGSMSATGSCGADNDRSMGFIPGGAVGRSVYAGGVGERDRRRVRRSGDEDRERAPGRSYVAMRSTPEQAMEQARRSTTV